MISKKPEACRVSKAEGARGLARYLRDPDIRVHRTDSTDGDIRVHRTDTIEGDATEEEIRKKSLWSKKKYWILAISVISLVLFALTLGLSLYFGLYHGKHDTIGDYF